MGNLEESNTLHRRALKGQREVLGPHHPATLLTFENLTDGLEKQQRYTETVTLLLELLEAYKNSNEPDINKRLSS